MILTCSECGKSGEPEQMIIEVPAKRSRRIICKRCKKGKGMTFIDLFCGAGGFTEGLKQAGHKCVLAIDNDKHACMAFKKNNPGTRTACYDISDINFTVNKADMIVGGPPCQGFSTAGKLDKRDPRNFLYNEFLRAVREVKPKVVMIENVSGFSSKYYDIRHRLINMGYTVETKLLDASDYGVPQNRKRLFIVGAKDKHFRFPYPGYYKAKVGDAFEQLPAEDVPEIADPEKLKILKHIPSGGQIRNEKDEKKYLPEGVTLGVNWKELPEKRFRQAKFQRLPWKGQSPTIMTSPYAYYHPVCHRYLTVSEAAAIQGFPADYKFHGNKTDKWRQIGNAVPPPLAKALGERLWDLQ